MEKYLVNAPYIIGFFKLDSLIELINNYCQSIFLPIFFFDITRFYLTEMWDWKEIELNWTSDSLTIYLMILYFWCDCKSYIWKNSIYLTPDLLKIVSYACKKVNS